jgi:Protein of unknown function (DUF3098)
MSDKNKQMDSLFTKDNYLWMGVGAVIIALGMILMSGGKNEDPKVYDYNVVYSFTRVTVAPILILLGFVVEIYAIFKKPKATN